MRRTSPIRALAHGPFKVDVFPYLVGLSLVVKILLTRQLVIGHSLGTGMLADAVFAAAVWAFAASVGGRTGRVLLTAVSLAWSFALLGLVVYASYFEQLPQLRMFGLAGQVRLGAEVRGLLTPQSLLLLADLPWLAWAAVRPMRGVRVPRRTVLAIGLLSLQIAAGLTVLSASMSSNGDAFSVAYRYGVLSYETASVFGDSMITDGEAVAVAAESTLQSQIDKLTGHVSGRRAQDAPASGAYAGKNVILIQMEALQAGLIGARIDGQPVLPSLEAFMKQSYYFPNTYSQIGRGNTSDAEFIANTSLLPPQNQAASLAYARKEIPSLPRLLEAAGYTTFTAHTNGADFWNRFQLYPALGFGTYFDRAYFGDDDITGHGPSDRVLFERTLPLAVGAYVEETPFYASIVTLSAHYPFRSARMEGSLELPDSVADTPTGRYLQAQSYADEQLGWFLTNLQKYGLLDECIVVIFGDHFGMRWADETEADIALRKQILGHKYNRADFHNIPLIVHVPGQDHAIEYQTVLGQIDIMPTVADLLGLDLEDVPHFGRSAFAETPTLLTRPGALPMGINDELMVLKGVNSKDDRYYASKTQEKLEISEPTAWMQNAVEQLQLCEEYASGLPERPGASDEVGRIPVAGVDFLR